MRSGSDVCAGERRGRERERERDAWSTEVPGDYLHELKRVDDRTNAPRSKRGRRVAC